MGICCELDQCVIALRLSNVTYKLCTMYELTICPSFVYMNYFEERRAIKIKLDGMNCSYCGSKGKLMCCTGCMETTYCIRLCQKRDWKMNHRKSCKGRWLEYYKMLKHGAVFDPL